MDIQYLNPGIQNQYWVTRGTQGWLTQTLWEVAVLVNDRVKSDNTLLVENPLLWLWTTGRRVSSKLKGCSSEINDNFHKSDDRSKNSRKYIKLSIRERLCSLLIISHDPNRLLIKRVKTLVYSMMSTRLLEIWVYSKMRNSILYLMLWIT